MQTPAQIPSSWPRPEAAYKHWEDAAAWIRRHWNLKPRSPDKDPYAREVEFALIKSNSWNADSMRMGCSKRCNTRCPFSVGIRKTGNVWTIQPNNLRHNRECNSHLPSHQAPNARPRQTAPIEASHSDDDDDDDGSQATSSSNTSSASPDEHHPQGSGPEAVTEQTASSSAAKKRPGQTSSNRPDKKRRVHPSETSGSDTPTDDTTGSVSPPTCAPPSTSPPVDEKTITLLDFKAIWMSVRTEAYRRTPDSNVATLHAAEDRLLATVAQCVQGLPSAIQQVARENWPASSKPTTPSCHRCSHGGDSEAHSWLCALPCWLLGTLDFSKLFAELACWLPADNSAHHIVDLRRTHCSSGISLRGALIRTGKTGLNLGIEAQRSIVPAASASASTSAPDASSGGPIATQYRVWTPELLHRHRTAPELEGDDVSIHWMKSEPRKVKPPAVFDVAPVLPWYMAYSA